MIPVFYFPDSRILEGMLRERIGRFLGRAYIGRCEHLIHIHDPGRVPLLRPNTRILLLESRNANRKTRFDLIAFWSDGEWIFSHSGYHSKIFEQTIKKVPLGFHGQIRKEVKIDKSRIDFMIGNSLIEIKGCTWIRNDCCSFPDAPTTRGLKHIEHLEQYTKKNNKSAYIIFLVFSSRPKQVKIAKEIDIKFYEAARHAKNTVRFRALKYVFDNNTIYFVEEIPVNID
ncbi:MAG: DNA/RNA nuclease SfsA [Candidatus Njordarchaeota archaeon]